MDALSSYNIATSSFLALEALPLLSSPSLVVWMLSTQPRSVTALETCLSRTLSFALLLVAFLNLLLSGEVQKLWKRGGGTTAPGETFGSPFATPTLSATLAYHVAASLLFYSSSFRPGLSGAGLTIGSLGHLLLGASAILLLMFHGEGRVSKRTGADKRTSGFPFKNAEADKRKAR